MTEGRNDTLLGHVVVLVQFGWPREEDAFYELLDRIRDQGGLRYRVFFSYVNSILFQFEFLVIFLITVCAGGDPCGSRNDSLQESRLDPVATSTGTLAGIPAGPGAFPSGNTCKISLGIRIQFTPRAFLFNVFTLSLCGFRPGDKQCPPSLLNSVQISIFWRSSRTSTVMIRTTSI